MSHTGQQSAIALAITLVGLLAIAALGASVPGQRATAVNLTTNDPPGSAQSAAPGAENPSTNSSAFPSDPTPQWAAQGDPQAQYNMGVRYDNGIGVPADDDVAVQWYRKAAEQGYADAQYNLAEMYRSGEGVRQDASQAVRWYRRAADQGLPAAQCNLGVMYDNGLGVTRSVAEAIRWYRRAAEQGNLKAQFNLGVLYASGEGVDRDAAEAARWYRKAAQQGDPTAQLNLGKLYDDGEGVPQDFSEAARWYRAAAEKGNGKAQYNLGGMYRTGQGVLQDDIEAMKWRLLAAANGVGTSEDIQAFRQLISVADYAEAQRRARQWAMARTDGQVPAVPNAPGGHMAPPDASGTAFCISTNGYFITCAHVVANASSITLSTAGQSLSAEIVRVDRVNDLAVLRANGTGFTAVPLALDDPHLGDKVFTVGYPNPDLQGLAPKYTDGAISALSGIMDDPRAYQITVPVQGGNSGGPLVDQSGNCVGIVVSKLNAVVVLEYTGDIPQNVNFAVKAGYARPLIGTIPELKAELPQARQGTASIVSEIEKAVGLLLVTTKPD
ncbi:MAG: trypsin-like peptidase domain-containing protein [Lentisphaerae bacterium]|nr:trypsin-like peptidase domain-containing protein [Lentisphaerota bacterium]